MTAGPAAAGRGPRRRPGGTGLPALILPPVERPGTSGGSWSPLTRIGDRTLLDYQLDLLGSAGVTDAYVVDAQHAAVLRDPGLELPAGSPKLYFPGRARRVLTRLAAFLSVQNALTPADEMVICLDANVATTQQLRPLIRCHLRNAALATLLLVPLAPPDAFQVDRFGRVHGRTDRPVPGRWRNGGVYVVTPEFFRRLPAKGDPESSTLGALAREQRLFGLRSVAGWASICTPRDAEEAAANLASAKRR